MAQGGGFLNITNHQQQPLASKSMDLNPKLSCPPLHSGTRQYIDSRLDELRAEMEARLLQKDKDLANVQSSLMNALMNMATQIGKLGANASADAVRLKMNFNAGQIEAFEKASASSAALIEPLHQSGIYALPKQIHSLEEIRELTKSNGHQLNVYDTFSAKQFANELAKFAKLRPGDKEIRTGKKLTVWEDQVSTTILKWIEGEIVKKPKFRDCPFVRVSHYAYAFKEGFKWPKQA